MRKTEAESILAGNNAINFLVKKCSGKLYNAKIDSQIKDYIKDQSLEMLNSLEKYNEHPDSNDINLTTSKEPVNL